MTPQCIAALYKIPPGGKSIPGNNLGIYERGDYVDGTSLDLFFANFTSIPQGTRPTRVDIDGFANSTGTDAPGEADLDFQLAYPIVYPQNITQYQTDDLYYSGYGSSHWDGLFNTFLDALDGVSRPYHIL
jgi:tripeptidyl-peptidase I